MQKTKVKLIFLALIFFGIFGLAESSQAATYYVSPNGNDNNPGTSNSRFQTIQRCHDVMSAGGTCIVGNGTYYRTGSNNYIVSLSKGGTASAWVTYKAETKWGAKLDGQNNAHYFIWVIMSANANYIRIEDFEITGAQNGFWNNEGAHHHVLKGNHMHHLGNYCNPGKPDDYDGSHGGGPVYCGANARYYTIDGNVMHDNGRPSNCGIYPQYNNYTHDHALYVSGGDVVIQNNIFYNNNAGWDIQASGGSPNNANWLIANNVFASHNPNPYTQHYGQIIFWTQYGYAPSNITIQNNISYDTPTTFIYPYYQGNQGYYIYNNLVQSGSLIFGQPSTPNYTSSGNIIGQDPKFVNPATRDFHLQATSPAIGKGLLTNAPTYDFDGNARGSTIDIGAYEYGGSTPPPPPPTGTTYLSDLNWLGTPTNGWGPVEKDQSNGEDSANDGHTLTLNGTTYAKGLGTHANSEISYNLGGQYAGFTTDIGIDDEMASLGSVVFQVFLDGTERYNSGTMTGATPTKTITLDVSGKNTLKLVVSDNGDGNSQDHADWANARLTAGTIPDTTPPAAPSGLKVQ